MNYPTSREEQAAYWHLKLQESDVSAEEIQAALEWQRDPQNRAALDQVARFWHAWPTDTPAGAVRARRGWRALPWRVAAALLVVVLGAGYLWFPQPRAAEVRVFEYASPVGQIETVTLPDGTRATLGGSTSLHVRYAADIRHVQLATGEALFEVAPDASRPFVVEMPNGMARALGTQFNIHRGPDEATVSVLEGVVRVTQPEWRGVGSVDLRAGNEVALAANGQLGEVHAAHPRDMASWRSGRLVFVERTLRSVAADLSRYSARPVLVEDPRLAEIRVSGTAKVEQLDAWLDAMGTTLGLRVVRDPSGIRIE